MKKNILILSLFLLLILSACSNKEKSIKIGFISTLTGQYSEVGINTMYGSQMAINEINENGGVDGVKLELLIRDDEANPTVAVEMQNELKELGCNVIIGHSLSIVAVETVNNANEEDILLLSPSIGTDLLTGIDDNLIRLVTTVYYESTSISEHMYKESPSKVMVITNEDNVVLTQYHLNAFTAFFTSKGYAEENQIIGKFYSNNQTDIEDIKNKIISEKPDAIMISSSNTDAAPFVNFIKGLDLEISIHLTSWAGTSIINRIDSVDTDDIYIYNDFVSVNKSTIYTAYKTSFEDLYDQSPDMLSTNGYDAVYILYNAFLDNTENNAESLKEYILNKETFIGVNDIFGIDEYGDNLRDIIQYAIIDGEFEPTE